MSKLHKLKNAPFNTFRVHNKMSPFFSLTGASRKANDEDSDSDDVKDSFQGYFIESRSSVRLVVPIDSEFKSASHYRMVCNKIQELGENDVVEFHIASPGGDLSGLTYLLHSIRMTEAETIAVIIGDCYSAASLLALSCDAVSVGPYANMLCHSCQFGTRGKSTDVRHRVNHVAEYADGIFKECYEHFLNETEIQEVLNGKELYLNYEEINKRLKHKYEVIAKQQEDMQQGCCGNPEGCDDIVACPFAQDCPDD